MPLERCAGAPSNHGAFKLRTNLEQVLNLLRGFHIGHSVRRHEIKITFGAAMKVAIRL